MTEKLLRFAARLFAALPLGLNRHIGAGIGHLNWLCGSKLRYDSQSNLRLAFPDMPNDERRALARASLVDTGRMLAETPWVWLRPPEQSLARIRNLEALATLKERLAEGRGAIIATPHIGNWELCSAVMATAAPLVYFYKAQRDAGMDAFVSESRARMGGRGVPLDTGGIREGLKCLRRGELLGILPDQEPESGVFAPFFAEPALTMTLISKLARRSGAPVMFCAMEREHETGGWRLHLLDADPDVAHEDDVVAAAALNRSIARCVAINPVQYLWDYRRFTHMPDGGHRDYRGARKSIESHP
ncbi:MAG: hypothetical protein CSB44_08105 [Gammaproteobacteria bacterium]|nr:MAG: hypothetical protein CSB44_08105 [Gammaproteobacteria bacterium]PIE36887.1 MAG: hypothetical protein CSA54_02845 [Gammaproteobacteria bacterium]